MFAERWVVILLLLAMVIGRFAVAAISYLAPSFAMELYGFAFAPGDSIWYFIRVWAIRDMAIAMLVLLARPNHLVPLLLACLVIETSDIIAATLTFQAGGFSAAQFEAQLLTILLPAMIPEALALAIIIRDRHRGRDGHQHAI